jgi:hypothetical protein
LRPPRVGALLDTEIKKKYSEVEVASEDGGCPDSEIPKILVY